MLIAKIFRWYLSNFVTFFLLYGIFPNFLQWHMMGVEVKQRFILKNKEIKNHFKNKDVISASAFHQI